MAKANPLERAYEQIDRMRSQIAALETENERLNSVEAEYRQLLSYGRRLGFHGKQAISAALKRDSDDNANPLVLPSMMARSQCPKDGSSDHAHSNGYCVELASTGRRVPNPGPPQW